MDRRITGFSEHLVAEETPSTLYVAREDDLASLKEHWAAARDGDPRAVLLRGPLGSGKRAMMGELTRAAVAEDEDTLIWRVGMSDEQDGTQSLVRMYAGLFQALHKSPLVRGRVEMALNAALPHQPQRVQKWYQAFIEGLKQGAPKPGNQEFQVIMPRDNPLIGLVEVATAIARKFPVIFEIQNLHNSQSLAIHAFVEAVLHEIEGDDVDDDPMHLLMVMGVEPADDKGKVWMSMPLVDLMERRADDFDVVDLQRWTEAEVGKYLDAKGLSSNAAEIARISDGLPGFIAELIDWLAANDRLGDDLSSMTLAEVADVTPDADELEDDDDDANDGGADADADADATKKTRKKATADDAERVAFLAALLGLSFPSGLLADMSGFERESVDDLLDATEDIYKELQFSKPLGTWIYQFHKALLRESVLQRHNTDEDKQLAARVGAFMERFLVGRGYPYLVKTLRIYAAAEQPQRAAVLRSMALGADQPQVWAMLHDHIKYFDDTAWPTAMRRTVYMHLVDRMVKGGDVNQTEGLWNEAMKWATDEEDRAMQAWLLFAGSQLDHRRQDLYRARDRANDALKLFAALDDKLKQGEVRSHLAMIELADGNPNAALDQATLAEEVAPIPPMKAQAEFVRGHVERRNKKLPAASEHFRKANEIAGANGLGPLALDSGLAFGETLLMMGEHSKAADILTQVTRIAGQLQNPVRERAATALLSQSHAALRNFEAALQGANRTLELTRALKFERLEPVDLYNAGFFNLMLKRPTEAVALFRQSQEKANPQDTRFLKELNFNMAGALLAIGEKGQAEDLYKQAVGPATESKDWRKVVAANQQLATISEEKGDTGAARGFLQAALQGAEQGGLKEERKGIRRKLDQLS